MNRGLPGVGTRPKQAGGLLKRVFTCLALLVLGACSRTAPPAPLQTLAGETFDVYLSDGVYHAAAPSISFSGSLKAVVESAVSQLTTAGSGGVVSFRAGDFDLGAEWFELYNIAGITFMGQGMDVTTLRNNSSANTDTEPFDCTRCDHITVRDMSVSAGGPERSTSDALDFDGSDGVTILRVKVTDSRARGIVFDGKGPASLDLDTADGNTIRDCVVTGEAIPSDGIQLLASSQNLVEGCTITDVGGQGIYMNKSSPSSAQPNKPSNDNLIRNNHIENVGHSGIRVNSGSRNEITDNTVLNSSDDAWGLDGVRLISYASVPCDDNRITDNVATDTQYHKTQKYGLRIFSAACHRTVVHGNDFSGNRLGAIYDGGSDTVYNAADPEPPSTPSNLSAAADLYHVTLTWEGSSDNVGVTGYELWRDGSVLVLLGNTTSYEDNSVQPGTTYAYQVRALDAVGNESPLSSAVSAHTDTANSLSFNATDDAYIRAERPNANSGHATTLRVDGGPVQDTLLKFRVADIGGPVNRAVLRLHNVNSASLGGSFYTASSTWDEASVTWNNAPAPDAALGSFGTVLPGTSYELDVTPVTREGWISFRIKSTAANGAYYSSKEGANPPQLIVTTTGNGAGNVPPSAHAQTASTPQNAPLSLTLSGSDSNGNCPLSFAITQSPEHGSLGPVSNHCSSGSGSADLIYTPDAGYSGPDRLAFTVSDPRGATSDAATVTLSVTPGPPNSQIYLPVHDSYVRADKPTTNYGSATSLKADGGPVQDMLLTFDITDLGSAQITSAALRLYNVNSASLGGRFYTASSTWDESSVSWNTAPVTGTLLGSLGSVRPGNAYEVDVSSAVAGNGKVSFRISSPDANGAYYSSKEGANPPQLIVRTR